MADRHLPTDLLLPVPFSKRITPSYQLPPIQTDIWGLPECSLQTQELEILCELLEERSSKMMDTSTFFNDSIFDGDKKTIFYSSDEKMRYAEEDKKDFLSSMSNQRTRYDEEKTPISTSSSSASDGTPPMNGRHYRRSGKQCKVQNCLKAAQTNGCCKGHGGGPRCQFKGCTKSSQGGGRCRAHGGGKRCKVIGCEKGTQRGDYCATHGGTKLCRAIGCKRNDRGGGLCASHGGGKRCSVINCNRPSRRKGKCSTHTRFPDLTAELPVPLTSFSSKFSFPQKLTV